MGYIRENIYNLNSEISMLCKEIGRDPNEIVVIAVTKTVDINRIQEAVDCGLKALGENKVQEIMDKYNELNNVDWHMIGHLQTNKVKYIVDKVKLIHSLDRLSLAEEINKRAKQKNIIMDVLVQVNVAREETKFGLDYEEVYEFIEKVSQYDNIRIKGLMTIAPYEDEPEEVRIHFKKLKEIYEEIKKRELPNVEMKYLSMGMTNDYKVAIEEGANIIRVGTGIFGKRDYTK